MIPKFILKIFNSLNSLFKFKEKKEKLNKELEKEFKKGKIILQVDKRDFENIKEFKEKTDKIQKIKEKQNE